MHLDPGMSLAGLAVGVVVGLTGMGGGALMTPILVLVFGTAPAAAVSSDLVTSLLMKPVGGAVHWRRATVHKGIVRCLLVGAVPGAFAGVFVLRAFGQGAELQQRIRLGLGAALLLAVVSMLAKQVRAVAAPADDGLDSPVRPLATAAVGVVGGLVVGMTSVGSGSLIIVTLMWLYPRLSNRVLVGTDLVQAIPLVGSAAVGHLLFGDVQAGVTASLLAGSLPGVYVGARLSARASMPWLRPVLAGVLLASALTLLHAPSTPAALAAVALAAGLSAVPTLRRRAGVPYPTSGPAERDTAARADLSKV